MNYHKPFRNTADRNCGHYLHSHIYSEPDAHLYAFSFSGCLSFVLCSLFVLWRFHCSATSISALLLAIPPPPCFWPIRVMLFSSFFSGDGLATRISDLGSLVWGSWGFCRPSGGENFSFVPSALNAMRWHKFSKAISARLQSKESAIATQKHTYFEHISKAGLWTGWSGKKVCSWLRTSSSKHIFII